jgi:hypothetical protein
MGALLPLAGGRRRRSSRPGDGGIRSAYKLNTPIIGEIVRGGVPIATTAMALIEQPG